MGIHSSKMKCLYCPAQSGKTQKVKERIELFETVECFGEETHLDVFISANNQILVKQTGSRFDKTYNWISKNKEKLNTKSLAFDILNERFNMVLMCSNNPRIPGYLVDLINELEDCSHFTKKINIWIDEADQSINLWSRCSDIISKNIIEQVTLVSATFDSVRKRYGRLQVIGYATPYPECYRSLKDSKKVICDFVGAPEDYTEHILEKYPRLTEPGVKAFIPGSFKKNSHIAIKEKLHEHSFAVLIINGDGKILFIPGQRPIEIVDSDTDEFKETLARIYTENKLYRFPFAITGLECISRGITFQTQPVLGDHQGFIFDYGIIPATAKNAEAYQLMARLFGNIGEFSNYKPCEIYSSSSNFKKIEKQESMAMNIPKMVYQRGLVDVGESEFKEAMLVNSDRKYQVFDTQEQAIEFGKTLGVKFNKRPNNKAPSTLLKDNCNPTVSDIISRMWGLDIKNPVRMVPTNENKWCVYWKSSNLNV